MSYLINKINWCGWLWLLLGSVVMAVACAGGPDNPADEVGEPPSRPSIAEVLGETAEEEDGATAEEAETEEVADIPGTLAIITPDGSLATVAPDGSNFSPLARAGIFQFPAWSPTGERIAAIGTNRDGPGVFVADAATGELKAIYRDRQRSPIYLYWTPNGDEVSFIARDPLGLALHIAPADGESESRVLATGQPFYWQWVEEGERLLIHTGSSRLAYLDRDGNEVATDVGKNGIFQAPALSRDGRFLAFSDAADPEAEEVEQRALIVNETANGEEARFRRNHKGIIAMSWSSQANLLAFMSPSEERATFFGPLSLLDAESGEISLLVPQDVIAFFWAPDGRQIAYLTVRDNTQQAKGVLGRIGEQRQRPLLVLSVIDVATRSQRTLLRFEPNPLFVTQFIPFFDQYALSHRLWSPDSRFIVLPTVSETGDEGITVIPVDGSEAMVVAEGTTAFWSHR